MSQETTGSGAHDGGTDAGGGSQLPPTVKLLLEEWKKNVDLYIDQDKRGMARINIFLLVNGGLLAFYGYLLGQVRDSCCALLVAGVLFPAIAGLNAYLCWRMGKRAHMYILLRLMQGRLIERKIHQMLAPGSPLVSRSGVPTTFSRESLIFREDKDVPNELRPLRNEIQEELGDYAAQPFGCEWRQSSMTHFAWLKWSFRGVGIIWAIVFLVTAVFALSQQLHVLVTAVFALFQQLHVAATGVGFWGVASGG